MFERSLQVRPVAVADARRHIHDRFDGLLSQRKLAEAELLTSELVTNAVRHARLKEENPIGLDIDVDTDTIHVAVVDGGTGLTSRRSTKSPETVAEDGVLFVVDKVSDRWGIDASPPHSVWFEIDR